MGDATSLFVLSKSLSRQELVADFCSI